MRPGSVILLPRGTYHTTLADDEDALSIGYHFTLPTWSQVVLAGLERRLTQDPVMRKTAFGAFFSIGPAAEALEQMNVAAERASSALVDPQRLLERDLLANLASHHQAAFRLGSDTPARLKLGEPPAVIDYAGLGIDVQLPAEADRLCRWMLDHAPGWFDFDTALAASGRRLSPRAVWDLLQEGVEAGWLERRWGRGE
jgi:hypothetical protein